MSTACTHDPRRLCYRIDPARTHTHATPRMSHVTTLRAALLSSLALAGAACMPTVAPAPTPMPAPGTMGVPGQTSAALPNDVHWFRNAAEHRAVYLEVYRAAGDRLQTLAAGHAVGTWGVILDADETILDNSDYERSRVPFGGTYDPAEWTAWVKQERAPALPGAVEYAARVHAMGGKVVVVTNRSTEECDPTRANLASVHFVADLVLCKGASGDKNPRFQSVQNGTAAAGFPAIAVLEWVGDNIQDFPGLTQAVRTQDDTAFARFGDTFFALPNPMYGSWESNPRQ